MSFEKNLSAFAQELASSMQGQDEVIMQKLQTIESGCFSQAGDDSDRFVKCMSAAMKKLDKQQKVFEFRMAFFQAKTAECFKKNDGNKEGIEKCKQAARENVDKYFQALVKGLD